MKISVDIKKCQGHTLCAISAPDLFALDENDGHAVVIPQDGVVPAGLEHDALRAAGTCPEQAITLE